MGGKADKSNYALKINGQEISINEYENTLNNMENTFKQLFGDQYNKFIKTVDIKSRVKDEIINRTLLYQESIKKKIPVSDREIIEEISKIPSFKTNGSFDEDKYKQILNANRLTPASFEESLKREMRINKLTYLIQNSVNVSPNEIKNEYLYRNSKAKISYIKVSPSLFLNKVTIDNESIEKYYNENKEKYRKPKEIKLKYVKFNAEDFAKDIKVSDEELQSYYIKNRLKYYKPERIKVRHILIRVKNWDNKTESLEALKKIREIQGELKKNIPFEKLAKEYSEDPSAQNGGLIGFIKHGDVVPEFEKAAFALKEGEVSSIVKTPFGYHLIKVDQKIPAVMPTLDELKDNLTKEIIELKKTMNLKEQALSFYRDILNEGNISAYAQKNPSTVKVYETDYFTRDNTPASLNLSPEIKDALFNMEQSEVSKIYYIGNDAYIFEVNDVKESYIPKLADIKNKVVEDYKNDKAKEIALEELKQIVQSGKDLTDIAKKYNANIVSTNYFKRIEPIDEIGSNTALQVNIFKTNKNSLIKNVFDINNYLYVVKVDDITLPDLHTLSENEKKNISDYLLEIKSKEVLNEYLRNLRKEAKIKVNPLIE
jgi:peptidyl-prolyl cis-trans isomerase D